MSSKLPSPPPVPDLARAKGNTPEEIGEWLIQYFNERSVTWNYRCGTRIIKAAYKGLHKLPQLIAGCEAQHDKQGRTSNEEIVRLAAPLAFGRSTQVFDLPSRKFSFGRDLYSSYRIPFFFTEGGVVKVFFLQPRKGTGDHAALSMDQLGMIAAIHKQYLLDVEFYGLNCDVEYVDLAYDSKSKDREIRNYSLKDIPIWSEEKLQKRLSLIVQGLQIAYESKRIEQRVRISKREPDMPLFD
ncbi:MAG: hypothetical protein ACRCWF_10845 [Beijerinckiaceae bacterium]